MASRTLQQAADPASFERMVRSYFDTPRAEVRITAGAEDGANTRRITLEAIDRLKGAWQGRWRVLVYLAAASGGDPSAAGNTVAWVTGYVVSTIVPNAAWEVLTDAAGLAKFDLTVAGVAARYVNAVVLDQVKESAPVAYV